MRRFEGSGPEPPCIILKVDTRSHFAQPLSFSFWWFTNQGKKKNSCGRQGKLALTDRHVLLQTEPSVNTYPCSQKADIPSTIPHGKGEDVCPCFGPSRGDRKRMNAGLRLGFSWLRGKEKQPQFLLLTSLCLSESQHGKAGSEARSCSQGQRGGVPASLRPKGHPSESRSQQQVLKGRKCKP